MPARIVAWFPLANAFSDECHRRGTIPGLDSHSRSSSFGVGSHDSRSVRVLPFVSPHRRLVSTPSCSDRRHTPHLNTTPTSKNDQRAGAPAGNSGVVRENSRGL